ncbi:MAG: DUF423 domain-containing protein [Planctomycetaceae bacterium]|nr:DUF423 domain-containing protein [Planctomycetaceae bacterium]
MDGENRLSSWVALGAALAGVAVMMGAIAAHGIESHLAKSYEGQTRKTVGMEIPAAQKYLADFKTASRYQMSHALGMIVVGLLATRRRSKLLTVAGWAFLVGISLFSGSLYVLSLMAHGFSDGTRHAIGLTAATGGTSFIIGWGCLAIAAFRFSTRP